MAYPVFSVPDFHFCRYVLYRHKPNIGQYKLVLGDASQFGDFALLPEVSIDAVLLDGNAEHLAGTHAIYITAAAEQIHAPFFTRQPCDHAGFYGRKVCNEKSAARTGHKGSADQLRKHIRGGIVEQAHNIIITCADDGTRFSQIGHIIPCEILQLHISPRKPSRAIRAVELKASAYTPVGTHRVFHSLILLNRALRQLLSQHKHRFQRLRGSFEQLGYLLFAQRVGFQPVFRQPVFHLLHGVRVVQHGELLQLSDQFLAGAFVNGDGVAHQGHVHSDSTVVDLLIEMVLIPDFIWYRISFQPLLNAHFGFHVAQIVGFEAIPFFRRIGGRMPLAVLAGDTKIADEVFPFSELLLIQPQCASSVLQGQRQAKIGRPDHGAVPAHRIKIAHTGIIRGRVVFVVQRIAVSAQPLGQTDALKIGVECPLVYTRI